ncbi:DUF6603 domain-containing protein [Streptomyces litchfieldiae]|uniref:Kelch repeat-containing protein n=1 Tax=Streptomyces litchfieldiae TaxID=3075543 RepID=A0ABU2N0Q1_9ACTN|nr:DUF6603 domain-containing protein [Streptomyces sp. DSM 44938]MDT0347464.1 kelch repeat-containing protein [Streptomyces sp. DSM 44938]
MSTTPGTFHAVLRGLRRILDPLTNGLTIEQAPAFFLRFGVVLTPGQAASLAGPLGTVRAGVTNYFDAVDELDEVLESGDLSGLLGATTSAISELVNLLDGLPALGGALGQLPGVPADFAAAFPRRLLDHLVTDLAETNRGLTEALEFTGILDREDRDLPGADGVTYTVDTLLPDRIGTWLGSPGDQLAALFDWGTPAFDGTKLLRALDQFLGMLGLPVLLDLTAPVLDLAYAEIRPRTDLTPPGVAIVLEAGSPPVEFQVGGPGWNLTVDVAFALPPGTAIVLQANGAVTVELPAAAAVEGGVRCTLAVVRSDDSPIVLFGTPGGSRLEARELAFEFDAGLRWDGTGAHGDTGIGGAVRKGRLVVDLGDADGFLATLLPAAQLANDFELGFRYSLGDGLRFDGSGALEIQLPAHLTLGPVEVTALTLSLRIEGTRFPLALTADFSAALGPLRASVQGVGLDATLELAEGNQGNLGPLDLSLGFRPPRGVGLVLDAGVVTGGGFLLFDPEKGEYAGALELELAGIIDVKAIGLITTRMPDGSSGFSLLIVMTAEFGGGGIQLGYGFTLLAVGGLIGLNRTMNLTALAEGVRSGAIESVMFPEDVVANAPRILSDLRAFFPPEEGTFLIGPMLKIGWGTPTLISISVGVIIEIPGNIAIVGVLRVALPTVDAPLLILQVNFIGAVEFDKSRFWFFASLFESRILFLTIDGEMGLLAAWGDDANLVLSVGGFHPSFTPPPLPFPSPKRVSIDILNQPGQLLRVSGYFAVTSNTVQFGARVELRLGFDAFGIEGHCAFDALFQFSPFKFIISISASVSLKAFGVGVFSIDLRFVLEGPAPWRAKGSGSISLLFFEISADFEITWGERRDTTLPPVDVLPLLAAEIAKLEGWGTRPPAGGTNPLVSLRQLPEGELVLHPLGTLFVRQRAIPLGIRLDRVGAQEPRDGNRFTVGPAPGSGLVQMSVTDDKFAMAQFQAMDDATKLSRPAFETQDAGLELAMEQGALAAVRAVRRSTRYEMIVIDGGPAAAGTTAATRARAGARALATAPTPARTFRSVSAGVHNQLLRGSSTSRSALSQQEARFRQPYAADDTVKLTGQRYVVAHRRNNRQAFPPAANVAGAPSTFRSQAAAADALADWVAADPSLAGALHVIPAVEAATPLAVPGTWTVAANPMPFAALWRAPGADAVPLAGGRVLVVGGEDGTGAPLAGAAVYDPATALWSPTGALAAGRRLHSATRLADGRVLVAGGVTGAAATGTAELYDPVTGTWSPAAAAMATARSGHSATRLADGRILVAGGTGARSAQSGRALSAAELFDPATGTWAATAPMTEARTGHQAVPLPDGRVLVVGGALITGPASAAPLGHCEVFDPATGAWTPTGSLTAPRVGHQATALPDGTVLVTGGEAPRTLTGGVHDPRSQRTAERHDPATGAWTRVADLPTGRAAHRAVPLVTGHVLVVGGTGGPAAEVGYPGAVLYDPAADTWTPTGALAVGRWGFAVAELADGRILAAGGAALSGAAVPEPGPGVTVPTATAEVFTP